MRGQPTHCLVQSPAHRWRCTPRTAGAGVWVLHPREAAGEQHICTVKQRRARSSAAACRKGRRHRHISDTGLHHTSSEVSEATTDSWQEPLHSSKQPLSVGGPVLARVAQAVNVSLPMVPEAFPKVQVNHCQATGVRPTGQLSGDPTGSSRETYSAARQCSGECPAPGSGRRECPQSLRMTTNPHRMMFQVSRGKADHPGGGYGRMFLIALRAGRSGARKGC